MKYLLPSISIQRTLKFNVVGLGTFLCLLFLASCAGPELPEEVGMEYEKLPETIDFNKDVKPILSDKCFACHGPDKGKIKAGLQLHLSEQAYAELSESPGKVAIKPGNLNKSEVFHRILTQDPDKIMPQLESNLSLSAKEKAILIKWIEDGAEYKGHWAFIKPEMPAIPETKFKESVSNPIDNFVLANLEQEQLLPSPRATKETLLRRLSLDLTGLPPSLEEIDAFLADDSPMAYEKQVDRLLQSPHYGEHLALDWMDLSRFADTHGYSVDRYRDMSPWRDWVIKAFNQNMPYDQFVTWQLAGDLLENPSREMILATAFNRIHPQNMEGGIVNEEFLVEYAADRATTVGQAFMGLTVACARCHDHKYDPVTQKNFYELTSFFNNLNESGQISWDNAMPVPTLLLSNKEEEQLLSYLEDLIDKKEKEIVQLERTEVRSDFDIWIKDESYRNILRSKTLVGLSAYYDLDSKNIRDRQHTDHKGIMKNEARENLPINLTDGKKGKALLLNGDTWLDLNKTGVYGRDEPFSISIWANIPKEINDGNILHKGDGAIIYNWRGYHLKIENDTLELALVHTAPGNAIIKTSKAGFPRDRWIHLGITYDGSSKASGLKLFLNGDEVETSVKIDNLYKDILFRRPKEPGLQIGARWRGKGIKGGLIDEIKVYNKELSLLEMMKLAEDPGVDQLLTKNHNELNEEEKATLWGYFKTTGTTKTKVDLQELGRLKKTYVDSAETIQEIMVMKETQVPVQAYVLDRGAYDAHGEKVFPKTPEAFFPMPDEYPKNRLGFAKWLFHEDHPLTARVAVNQYWQKYFGVGLVKTSEDFGNQGEMPSHPELLDWLAQYFMDVDWNLKELQKIIVMSNTYRQTSTLREGDLQRDMENRLLARGPALRLTGEMLRDNALFSSGLLNTEIGGKSVKPYQPEGLWRVNGGRYQQDKGEQLYRRSLYTIWKRSVPHPTIATFDAPARDVCSVRRQKTNTPLQALVLLNDPTYIEAARIMGKNMLAYSDHKEGLSVVFRKLTGRKATSGEMESLLRFQEEEYQKFKEHRSKTKGWLSTGDHRLEKEEDGVLIAANAAVVSLIMNTDATITKR